MSMKLEKWAVKTSAGVYTAPELHQPFLFGHVFGNPKHKDGTCICTSPIIGKRGESVVTRHSVYELGQVNEQYAQQFPDAKEKLLASLEDLNLQDQPIKKPKRKRETL